MLLIYKYFEMLDVVEVLVSIFDCNLTCLCCCFFVSLCSSSRSFSGLCLLDELYLICLLKINNNVMFFTITNEYYEKCKVVEL
jgi:hypothetical protein